MAWHPGQFSSHAAFTLAFATITFLHIVLGELAPKSLAIQRPREVSLGVAAPLLVFHYIFYPFIYILTGRPIPSCDGRGCNPPRRGNTVSRDVLEYVLSHSRHVHRSDALINKFMVRSLRLRDVTAQQVMLPRDQVIACGPTNDGGKPAHRPGQRPQPLSVCQGSIDDVLGMVLVKEWLWQLQALGSEASFQPLIRPVLTFTPARLCPPCWSFSELPQPSGRCPGRRGKMAGIITFEDALEEIVGEIRDELDIERRPDLRADRKLDLVDEASPCGNCGRRQDGTLSTTSGNSGDMDQAEFRAISRDPSWNSRSSASK